MGTYAWKTKNREGTLNRRPNYSVKWEWTDPDAFGTYIQFTDLTYATNAERAISKIRRNVMSDFDVVRRDITIVHAMPYNGED